MKHFPHAGVGYTKSTTANLGHVPLERHSPFFCVQGHSALFAIGLSLLAVERDLRAAIYHGKAVDTVAPKHSKARRRTGDHLSLFVLLCLSAGLSLEAVEYFGREWSTSLN